MSVSLVRVCCISGFLFGFYWVFMFWCARNEPDEVERSRYIDKNGYLLPNNETATTMYRSAVVNPQRDNPQSEVSK
jgi:hypothetical protein